MKKIKITYLCAVLIILFSGIMLGGFYENMYCGVDFESGMYPYIINGMIFICFVLIEKNSPFSYFAQDNLTKLVRISSRRKALVYDIIRIFITVLFLECCECAGILVGSIIYGRTFVWERFASYFMINYVIKLLLILIQFLLEKSISYNFSFLLVYAVFLCGLYSGEDIYQRMLYIDDSEKRKIYEMINRFNIANYTSLLRIKQMGGCVYKDMFIISALIFIVIVLLFIYIKKVDLLKKGED